MSSFFPHLRRLLILVCLAQTLLVSAVWADQDDLIINREVWRDPTGTTTIDQVVEALFAQIEGIFAGGYTGDTVWMRLLIRPAPDKGRLQLRIEPVYLNEITLYCPDPTQPEGWRSWKTGNGVPWRDRPLADIGLGFELQLLTETTCYLRLNTLSNALLHLEAVPEHQSSQQQIYKTLWQGLYLSVILWIVFWALQDYFLNRDRLPLVFALTYTCYLLYLLGIMGYLSLLLPEQKTIPQITSFFVTLATLSSVIFHRSLLNHFVLPRFSILSLNILLAGVAFACVLLLAGYIRYALPMSSLVALLAGPTLFVVSLTAKGNDGLSNRQLRIYYGLLFISVISYIAPILGLTKASGWVLYGALMQGLVSAILFAHLLHMRSRQLYDQRTRAQLKLILSEHQIAQHKALLAEQASFAAMLTHEVKNPLAAIRLSLDAMPPADSPAAQRRYSRIDHALRDIDALVERFALSDRIEQKGRSLQLAEVDLPDLIEECVTQKAQSAARIVVAVDKNIPRITTDPYLLSIAVGNLLENALKYSPADSAVDLHLIAQSATDAPAALLIEVANLPGQAGTPDPLKVFDKYYRGEGTSRQSGFGLGLYLVREIAEQLGGQIECAATDTHIVFRLWLPIISH